MNRWEWKKSAFKEDKVLGLTSGRMNAILKQDWINSLAQPVASRLPDSISETCGKALFGSLSPPTGYQTRTKKEGNLISTLIRDGSLNLVLKRSFGMFGNLNVRVPPCFKFLPKLNFVD